MERGNIDAKLLMTDTSIWRSPHVIQATQRGQVRWDEFLRTSVEDFAFGMSPERWIDELMTKEGNLELARELAATVGYLTQYQLKAKTQEEEWRQLVQIALDEGVDYLAIQAFEITEDDKATYNESVEIANQYISERAYGDALGVLELAINTLKSLVENRKAAASAAFEVADAEIKKVRVGFVSYHPRQFPGGEVKYDQARRLLLNAEEKLLARDYTMALRISSWVRDLSNGKELSLEAQHLLTHISLAQLSSPIFEITSNQDPVIVQPERNPESNRKWTKSDDEYLIDNYDVLDNQHLMQWFATDEKEIEQRIQHLGLVHERGTGKKLPWRNPYVAGKPLRTSKVFVGREDVFTFIADNRRGYEQDQDRNLVVLLGHRRTGKTSILLQLCKNRREILEPRIPIFIDMEGLLPFPGGLRNFFWKIACKIHEELTEQENITLLTPLEENFKDPSWEFQQFLKSAIAELNGRGLVIMFDEFHAIEPGHSVLDINVYKMLRSVIQHNTNVDFILAGTMQMETLMRTYQAAMFGSAIIKKIDFLDEQDARKLIVQPVQNQIHYSQEAVDMIINVTASHPYFVQLICWALTQYLIERGKNKVSVNDVERILPLALERGVHFDEIWATDTSELERYIMALVGELAPDRNSCCTVNSIIERLRSENQMPRNPDELDEAISNLTNRRILKRSDDGSGVQFQVHMFGSWVSTNKPFDVVRRDIRAEEATRRRKIERQPKSS